MEIDEGKLFYNETNAIHNLMLNFEFMNKQCLKLGRVECNVLQFLLQENQPVSMKEIAAYMKVSHSRITHLMDSLLKKGYITRTSGTDDRRVYFATITKAGVKIAGVYKNKNIDMFKDFLKKLPKEQIEPIYAALEYWLSSLQQMITIE